VIHDVVFRAYFVENMNLADIDNLIAIAVEAGLSPEEAKEVLQQRRFSETVDADWQRSRDLGITGVPTFVIGNRALVGAQPYEQLEKFLVESGVNRNAT
jgi:predicted DsbA family dithiol-disulfide isomerase